MKILSVLLFMLCLWLGNAGTAYGQKENAFSFSYNKDLIFVRFKANNGGYIRHTWGLNKGWYLGSGIGFWSWERSILLINISETDLLITILPDYDFALKDVVSATDGRVGFAQLRNPLITEIFVPVYFSFGRSWLRKSKRFSLETDLGLLVFYYQTDMYGWADFIAIQSGLTIPEPQFVNRNGDPAYWLLGKAFEASIEPGFSINVEGTYSLTDHFGLGLNIFSGGSFFHGGYSTFGLHFKYRY